MAEGLMDGEANELVYTPASRAFRSMIHMFQAHAHPTLSRLERLEPSLNGPDDGAGRPVV
jgi:hypothetical protein